MYTEGIDLILYGMISCIRLVTLVAACTHAEDVLRKTMVMLPRM